MSISVNAKRHTKVVKLPDLKHGGKTALRKARADFRAEVDEKLAHGSSRKGHTLREAADAYIDMIRATPEENGVNGGKTRRRKDRTTTVEGYETALKRIPDALMDKPVTKVSTHDLDVLAGKLDASYARSTRDLTLAVLRAVLRQAWKWEWIPSNPAARMRSFDDEEEHEQYQPVAEDVTKLARAFEAKGDSVLAAAVVIGAITGLRRGELCGLKWEDLDEVAGTLTVARQLVPMKGGQAERPPKSKTGKRTIYLDPEDVAIFQHYRDQMRARWEAEPNGWILSDNGGHTALRAKSVTEKVSLMAASLGMIDENGRGLTVHALRRFHASELIAADVDVATAAARIGNTKEVLLPRYVKAREDKAIAAAAALRARRNAQGLVLAPTIELPTGS